MRKVLIVVLGMQGSGKTTLLSSNINAKVLKPSTERTRREGELDDYYFETNWEDNTYAWEIKFGSTRYGMRQEELYSDYSIGVTVFDPGNIDILIKKIPDIPFEVVTVGLDTLDTLTEQNNRVNNDPKRSISDQKIFDSQKKAVQSCDAVIKGNAETLLNAFNSILEILSTRGGILHDQAIKNLIAADCLLENAEEELIQTASYDLSLGDKYWCQGKYITLDDNNTSAQIPPYSYILVQAREMAKLPRFIAADFDTTVSLFLNGVVLSNGPQVDPGYKGALFCMLYNASHTPMGITRGKHFATIQFTTTTRVAHGYKDKYQNKKKFEDFLDGKVSVGPGGQIFEELEKVEKKVRGEVGLWRTAVITINIGLIAAIIALSMPGIILLNSKVAEINVELTNAKALESELRKSLETSESQKKALEELLTKQQKRSSRPNR